MKPQSDPAIRLFDEVIMAKKARGRPGITAGLSRLSTIRQSAGASVNVPPSRGGKVPSYLSDTSDHIWRTASVPVPKGNFPGEYHAIISRTPARLDRTLMREPRAIQGVPRMEQRGVRGLLRKQVPSMVGPPPPQ